MTDVGAVLLTLGESSTARALASLQRQSLAIAEVVVVDGVTPFHRALNTGAVQITSPFFLQVDSDFVLDRRCARTLREAIGSGDGIAVGALRDALIGSVAGVKLFRRECFEEVCLRDTIAPEVDFLRAIADQGWRTRYVISRGGDGSYTLGEHSPDHTVDYVFGTYYMLGARYAAQDDAIGLLWRFNQLRRSPHLLAPVARVALGHGVFGAESRDVAKPVPAAGHGAFLRTLVGAEARRTPTSDAALRPLLQRRRPPAPTLLMAHFAELGASTRASSAAAFRELLGGLGRIFSPESWIAEVALAHGALGGRATRIPAALMGTLERLAAPELARLFPDRDEPH